MTDNLTDTTCKLLEAAEGWFNDEINDGGADGALYDAFEDFKAAGGSVSVIRHQLAIAQAVVEREANLAQLDDAYEALRVEPALPLVEGCCGWCGEPTLVTEHGVVHCANEECSNHQPPMWATGRAVGAATDTEAPK